MSQEAGAEAQVDRGRGGQERPQGRMRSRIRWRLALPLVAFALVVTSVGLAMRYMYVTPHNEQTLSLFFSDTLHLKTWLATVALALGCLQLLTAARIYEVLRFPPQRRFYNIVHRWSGRSAILITLPVAFYCLFLVGLTPIDQLDVRVLLHMALGGVFYGVFVAKLFLVRMDGFPGWALPVAGSLLFTILLGLWLTSAYWVFTYFGVSL
jgi:hypothetical protein